MRDPFLGSPILRLTGPQHGTQPTLKANAQALAQHTQTTKPREYIAEGIAEHWVRLHSSRTGLRALTAADGGFAARIDTL